MPFWRILTVAAVLSAVAVAVMVGPKRTAPKPELVTIEFSIGGNKFTVTGTPVERFEEPQMIKADLEVH